MYCENMGFVRSGAIVEREWKGHGLVLEQYL